jgi:hypothetical protein
MKRLSTLGIVAAAALFCAAPLSVCHNVTNGEKRGGRESHLPTAT